MNIEEATRRKARLIEDITEMLSTFTATTGLLVDSIDIERLYRLGPDYSPRHLVNLEVKL